ncbi:MAG: dockerin type I domain-containing protein [Singulisphaera sp.]
MLRLLSTRLVATVFMVAWALVVDVSADIVATYPGPHTFSTAPDLQVLSDVSTIGLQGTVSMDIIAPDVTTRQFVWVASSDFDGAVPPGIGEMALQIRNGRIGLSYWTAPAQALNAGHAFESLPFPTDGLVHHVSVTWKDGGEVVLHVDGAGNGARQLAPFAEWSTQPGTNVLGGEPWDNGQDKFQFKGTVSNFVLQDSYSYVQGDVNFDGIVNGQDIALVASQWLATNPIPNWGVIAADANMDDIVNGQDIAAISSSWLQSAPPIPGAAQAVPEPSAMLLLMLGAATVGFSAIRRRFNRVTAAICSSNCRIL